MDDKEKQLLLESQQTAIMCIKFVVSVMHSLGVTVIDLVHEDVVYAKDRTVEIKDTSKDEKNMSFNLKIIDAKKL